MAGFSQFRPGPGTTPDARFYNPERDPAYQGRQVLAACVRSLSAEVLVDWAKEAYARIGMNDNKLNEVVDKLVSLISTIQDLEIPSFTEAWKASKMDCSEESMLLMAQIGRAYLSFMFYGTREVNDPDTVKVEVANILEELSASSRRKE